MSEQIGLFGAVRALPEGFRYQADLITPDEEQELLHRVRELPFKEFEFHGFTGKRRVVSFGWRYSFSEEKLEEASEIPPFLTGLRERAARFAEIEPEALRQALVTEYGEGAGIGWHRDKSVFGDVIGVSLASACVFRLRRKVGTKWERASIAAAPRSVYLMRGPSRTEWEHSIPGVDALRYSITFRSLRDLR
jgi:alkylated DNA repair dioxygenase AlkB